ncbi:DUF3048 domain-containing protein [Candidatus Dojkabacteria bacterium]|nr:DUF3048 domain-containing protein [Candidatus Dojkabacteria bacterium]
MVLKVDLSKDDFSESDYEKKTQAGLPDSKTKQKIGFAKRIRNKFRVMQASIAKMPVSHKVLIMGIGIAVAGLASIAAVYGFIIFTIPGREPIDTTYKLLEVQVIRGLTFSSNLPSPPKVRDHANPINGELYTRDEFEELSKNKPLLVMIENSVDARPQAGLSNADLVYETLAESGITRFMAVFWSSGAEKVGPIRSLRTYFLDWSSEYDDPPICNIGQAGYDTGEEVVVPEADARAYIKRYDIKSFDWYGRKVTWRDTDKYNKGVAWEHVAYSETKTLWDEANVMGWTGPGKVESLKFKKDALKEQRPLSQEIEIKFLNLGGDKFKVKWTFDKDSNSYKRYLGGEPHIDENNSKQISAKNIIIQHCQYKATGDKNGRIVFTTIGEGNVEIFRDGKQMGGTWKKDSRTSRTKFFDKEGNEIELNRGQIWIEIVPVSGNTELSTITIR